MSAILLDIIKSRLPDPLADILKALAYVAIQIRSYLACDAFGLTSGGTKSQNVHGETQQPLDLLANQWAIERLKNHLSVAAILSEEEPEPLVCHPQTGAYLIALDPLDGSTNIGLGIPVGTLFSVFKRQSPTQQPLTPQDYLPPGTQQVLAGYFLYGTATALVYNYEDHIASFTYLADKQDFFQTPLPNAFPTDGKIYSVNDALAMSAALRAYLATKQGLWSARYVGALVADFHRNLLKGGLFSYPATPSHPQGKLRLLYECNPLARIAETAGGIAINEQGQRILDLKPTNIHQRTTFYVGTKAQIQDWLAFQAHFKADA